MNGSNYTTGERSVILYEAFRYYCEANHHKLEHEVLSKSPEHKRIASLHWDYYKQCREQYVLFCEKNGIVPRETNTNILFMYQIDES